jgi:PKD repeat protein
MKSDFKGLFIFQSWSIGIASVMLTVIFLIIPALAAANNPPAANPTATPDIGPVPATVQFAANATDPDGDTLTYFWSFGNGTMTTEADPVYTYTVPGTYSAELTVSDGQAAVSALLTITVTPLETYPVFNTGVGGYWPTVSGSLIAFMADEWQDGRDYDGDGLAEDNIVVYYDTTTGTLTSTNQRGWDTSIDGSIIAFYHQSTRGIAYYDISTGETHLLNIPDDYPTVSGSLIAFDVHESWLGRDVTGDGEMLSGVIAYYDISTDTLVPTDAIGNDPKISGPTIAFTSYEKRVLQDLNGDGDMNDTVIRYHDLNSGTTVNTGMIGSEPDVSGSFIAFHSSEIDLGQDINGDGILGAVPMIRYYDMSSGTVTNTGVIGWPSIDGSIIAYTQRESFIGDLNGDGDTLDDLIGYYDISTGEDVTTDVHGQTTWVGHIGGRIIAFETFEKNVGLDLNGNGKVWTDYVVRYIKLPSPPPSLPQLSEIVDEFVADGSVENEGVTRTLHSFLEQAQAMLNRGNPNAARGILGAFVKFTENQKGRHITEDASESMVQTAQEVIGSL